MMENEFFDEKTLLALKKCLTGLTIKEITTEYAMDEETGKLKIQKQKVLEKTIPPNADLIKFILTGKDTSDFTSLSSEELEKEKIRLLKQLKEEENGC